jgi:hypothetical protein
MGKPGTSVGAEAELDLDLSNPTTKKYFLHRSIRRRVLQFRHTTVFTRLLTRELSRGPQSPPPPKAFHRRRCPDQAKARTWLRWTTEALPPTLTSLNQGCDTQVETWDFMRLQRSPGLRPPLSSGPTCKPLAGRFCSTTGLRYSTHCNDPLREIFWECSR